MVYTLWQSKAWYVSWSLDRFCLGIYVQSLGEGWRLLDVELALGPLCIGYDPAWDCPIDLDVKVRPRT